VRARRLKTDFEPRAGRGCKTFQRLRRWPGPTALQPGNNRLCGIHSPCELFLRKTGCCARSDNRVRNLELGGELFMSLPVFFSFHPFLMKVLNLGHRTISFARCSASPRHSVPVSRHAAPYYRHFAISTLMGYRGNLFAGNP